MTDVSVPKGTTVKLGQVEGDLKVGEHARIEAETAAVNISGRVVCMGDADFVCGVSCIEFSANESWGWGGKISIRGDLKCAGKVDVSDGQLVVDGSLEASRVSVDKVLRVGKDAKAEDFDVGGVLEVGGTISGKKVDVGGQFKVHGAVEV